MNNEFISELARRLVGDLPENLRVLGEDLQQNFEAVLQSSFSRLDLVTREEFEIQRRVLAATRARLEQLERELERLESERAPGEQPH